MTKKVVKITLETIFHHYNLLDSIVLQNDIDPKSKQGKEIIRNELETRDIKLSNYLK